MIVRTALVMGMVLLALAVLWLMRRAWVAKAAGQSTWPAPAALPFSLDDANVSAHPWVVPPTQVRFLGSNLLGDWLSRAVVFDLGVPSQALIAVDQSGVWLDRQGALSVLIPADCLIGARSDRVIAGRAYEEHGVLVVSWRLGDVALDSGFRVQPPDLHADLVTAVETVARHVATQSHPSRTGQPGSGGSL